MPGGALEVLVYGPGREPRQLEPIVEAMRTAAGLTDTEVEAWYQREPWLSMMGMMDGIQGFIEFFIIMLAARGLSRNRGPPSPTSRPPPRLMAGLSAAASSPNRLRPRRRR